MAGCLRQALAKKLVTFELLTMGDLKAPGWIGDGAGTHCLTTGITKARRLKCRLATLPLRQAPCPKPLLTLSSMPALLSAPSPSRFTNKHVLEKVKDAALTRTLRPAGAQASDSAARWPSGHGLTLYQCEMRRLVLWLQFK